MVTKDLVPQGLPLGMAKSPTQQKAAFHLISFLDTTQEIHCLILSIQVDLILPPQENLLASWAQELKVQVPFLRLVSTKDYKETWDCLYS